MAGDGHWASEESGAYYTISNKLKDDILEICILLGYSASVYTRQRDNRNGLSYEVRFTKRNTTEVNSGNHLYDVDTTNSKVNVDRFDYSGYVYCLTVPETETFFVRQNGYVWVSGNTWVKKMFVDPEVPGKAFWATDVDTGEVLTYPQGHEKEGQPLFKRRFIPARLKDNPYLAKDGVYETALLSLPEDQRRKLLEGDWSVNEGAAFKEFNPKIHIVEPFEIPESWARFRAADFGYSSNSAVLWFAIDPSTECLVVYRELYVRKFTGIDLAKKILYEERDERVNYGVLDSSVWHQRGNFGPSIAEEMIANGCRWRPSDRGSGSRISGKNRLHELLKVDEYSGVPGIVFFNTCRQVIADLPMIPSDPDGGDDIDVRYKSDHTYDALRYGIMSRPKSRSNLDWGTQPISRFHPADSVFGY
jgi:hypothetical protein